MSDPTISVCIAAYNAERYVALAIESVLGQTYPFVEIIVVNDGSTDGTRKVLSHYSDRVKIIDQDNRGQSVAVNRAFLESSGDLVKFFDADDVMAPDMLSLQVTRLGDQRDCVAMGEWVRFYGERPTHEEFPNLSMYRDALPVDWIVEQWEFAEPMMQCGLWLIPRDIINIAGLWDERLSLTNDFEYFTRVLTSARGILYSPKAHLYYRSGISGSLSSQRSRVAIESHLLSLQLGTARLLALENSPRTRRASANMLQSFEYEYYPSQVDLRAKIRERVAELGGSDLEPNGPPGFHKLRAWMGWRAARCVQRAAERVGLNRASRISRLEA